MKQHLPPNNVWQWSFWNFHTMICSTLFCSRGCEHQLHEAQQPGCWGPVSPWEWDCPLCTGSPICTNHPEGPPSSAWAPPNPGRKLRGESWVEGPHGSATATPGPPHGRSRSHSLCSVGSRSPPHVFIIPFCLLYSILSSLLPVSERLRHPTWFHIGVHRGNSSSILTPRGNACKSWFCLKPWHKQRHYRLIQSPFAKRRSGSSAHTPGT